MMTKNNINAIDLFAGAGGMSEGFQNEGFNILSALEIDKIFSETFRINHPKTKVITADIKSVKVSDFKKGTNQKIDLILGGPPCQGFSEANRQQFIDDPRNKLYKEYVRFVNEIKPSFFVMENVKGIIKKADEVIKDFGKIGYEVDYILLNARDFGIPQNRERVFFIGTKIRNKNYLKKVFADLEKEKVQKVTPLKEALWGLRKLSPNSEKNNTEKESPEHGFTEDTIQKEKEKIPEYILKINQGKLPRKVFNHKSRYNNERDREIFKRLPQGGKSDHHSIQDIMPYKNRSHIFKDKFFRLEADKPSKTICAHMKFDCHMYIHPFEARGLTPREAARIQGFRDDYKFAGSLTRWYQQIGNAVPPPLAGKIAKVIKKYIHDVDKK